MPEYEDQLRHQLWVGAREVLRRNRFREVLRSADRSYWRRASDGAAAILSSDSKGEPKVTRLDK